MCGDNCGCCGNCGCGNYNYNIRGSCGRRNGRLRERIGDIIDRRTNRNNRLYSYEGDYINYGIFDGEYVDFSEIYRKVRERLFNRDCCNGFYGNKYYEY
jgi:hypothetical protein